MGGLVLGILSKDLCHLMTIRIAAAANPCLTAARKEKNKKKQRKIKKNKMKNRKKRKRKKEREKEKPTENGKDATRFC